MLPRPARYNVLGIGISALRFDEAVGLLLEARADSPRGYVCCATAHGVTLAQTDPALRRAYRNAWLNTPDGMPLVWLGPSEVERVYGPDLLLATCDRGRSLGLSHYFYGGGPGIAARLAGRLEERFPGLNVAGTGTPPFRPLNGAEVSAFQAEMRRLRPDLLWIGLGAPRQEVFMAEHAAQIPAGALIGIGAAFDFHSGAVRQAPPWIRGSGLEWAFRLATEPRRLARRYLTTTPLFAVHALAQQLGLRRYPEDGEQAKPASPDSQR